MEEEWSRMRPEDLVFDKDRSNKKEEEGLPGARPGWSRATS